MAQVSLDIRELRQSLIVHQVQPEELQGRENGHFKHYRYKGTPMFPPAFFVQRGFRPWELKIAFFFLIVLFGGFLLRGIL